MKRRWLRRGGASPPGDEVAQLGTRIDTIEAFASEAVAALAAQQRALEGLDARIANLERAQAIWSTTAYVRDAVVDEKALVSVVLATRNRSGYLRRAVRSVLAQSHPTWELLAVDDGSDDDTAEVLAAFDDERVRCFRTPHRGVSAARNFALREAAGDYVAYLDDDNTMHPDWLRAVVWAFTAWKQIDLLYGATLIDGAGAEPAVEKRAPWLWFVPFDRDTLARQNLTDIGAIAHRAGLPDAVFDEQLEALADWDLLLRVSEAHEPLALPVVAGSYSTTAPDRLSAPEKEREALRRLHRKHAVLDSASTTEARG